MSWPTAKLGELCDIISGATPKTGTSAYWDGDVAWATPKDLSDLGQKRLQDTPRKLTALGLKSCSSVLLPPQSVLLSSRAPIGLVAINTIPVCTNQGFKNLVPRNGSVDTDYLYWWLKCHNSLLQSLGVGATFKEISTAIVSRIEIPVPPLAEQKRIAAILDAADDLRAKRRQALAQLDTFLQATFIDMFGDPVTNPKGWQMGVVGDLLESAKYGTSEKADEKIGRIPILRMNNITYSGGWDFTSLKYIDFDEDDLMKYLVQKGQILFNRTNSKELVGKTAVYRLAESMAFAGYLVRGIVNKYADPEYIGAFMNMPHTKKYLRNKCKSIVGMANINAKEFQAIPIPKPPVELQRQFGHFVGAVEKQKIAHHVHLAELDTLFASLQSRAFRGEL